MRSKIKIIALLLNIALHIVYEFKYRDNQRLGSVYHEIVYEVEVV